MPDDRRRERSCAVRADRIQGRPGQPRDAERHPAPILAEWAKVGGTRIINGDRVPGTAMTIRLPVCRSARRSTSCSARPAATWPPRGGPRRASRPWTGCTFSRPARPPHRCASAGSAQRKRVGPRCQRSSRRSSTTTLDEEIVDIDEPQAGRGVPTPRADCRPSGSAFPNQPGQPLASRRRRSEHRRAAGAGHDARQPVRRGARLQPTRRDQRPARTAWRTGQVRVVPGQPGR